MMRHIVEKARTFRSYPSYWGRSLFPDTVWGAKGYNKTCKLLNWSENGQRKQAFGDLSHHLDKKHIKESDGFLVTDMMDRPSIAKGLEYACKLAGNMNMSESLKTSKKSFLLNHALDMFNPDHKPLLDLATDPELLAIIAEYLGDVPVLASIAIWFSPNDGDTIQRSQLFHIDGEDSRQIKCFLPIETVTSDSGPLTILSAEDSEEVYTTLKRQKRITKRNEKLEDEVIYDLIPEKRKVQVTGNPGTVAMVDTSRCYHYGSRPAKHSRLQLHVQYYTPYSMNMPIWGRAHKARAEHKGESLIFKTVTGLSHLDFAAVRRRKGAANA